MSETHDTPTQRAAINQLSVSELDTMLEGLRVRRLERVKKLEALAKVKSDQAQLMSWLRFERAYGIAMRYLKKCEALEDKAVQLVQKARIAAMAAEMEVGERENVAD